MYFHLKGVQKKVLPGCTYCLLFPGRSQVVGALKGDFSEDLSSPMEASKKRGQKKGWKVSPGSQERSSKKGEMIQQNTSTCLTGIEITFQSQPSALFLFLFLWSSLQRSGSVFSARAVLGKAWSHCLGTVGCSASLNSPVGLIFPAGSTQTLRVTNFIAYIQRGNRLAVLQQWQILLQWHIHTSFAAHFHLVLPALVCLKKFKEPFQSSFSQEKKAKFHWMCRCWKTHEISVFP